MISTPNIKVLNEALDSIRSYLIEDGGDVEVVDISADGEVSINLKGNCKTCIHKNITIRTGIESVLKEKFNNITKIIEINSPS